MAKKVEKPQLPQTDSIEELAHFWDAHDLTDFEDQLEEVQEPVFERENVVSIHLHPNEARAVKEIAVAQGIDIEDLIRQWVRERLQLV